MIRSYVTIGQAGCPQKHAQDGHYGAYLLARKDWPLLEQIGGCAIFAPSLQYPTAHRLLTLLFLTDSAAVNCSVLSIHQRPSSHQYETTSLRSLFTDSLSRRTTQSRWVKTDNPPCAARLSHPSKTGRSRPNCCPGYTRCAGRRRTTYLDWRTYSRTEQWQRTHVGRCDAK